MQLNLILVFFSARFVSVSLIYIFFTMLRCGSIYLQQMTNMLDFIWSALCLPVDPFLKFGSSHHSMIDAIVIWREVKILDKVFKVH